MSANKKAMFYFDGKKYDLLTSHFNDVSFYMDLPKQYGRKILELGIGTGRLGLQLAASGNEVTGIDISASMLKEAREKAARDKVVIRLAEGDMSSFDLQDDFDVIIIAFNSIHHLLSHEQIHGLLRCIKKHLRPKGIFAFDMYNTSVFPASEETVRYPLKNAALLDDPDYEVMIEQRYDMRTQVQHSTWQHLLKGRLIHEETNHLRLYAPQELEGYLKLSGLEIAARYSSFDKSPFDIRGEKSICLVRHSLAEG